MRRCQKDDQEAEELERMRQEYNQEYIDSAIDFPSSMPAFDSPEVSRNQPSFSSPEMSKSQPPFSSPELQSHIRFPLIGQGTNTPTPKPMPAPIFHSTKMPSSQMSDVSIDQVSLPERSSHEISQLRSMTKIDGNFRSNIRRSERSNG
jgi:hypothetical protein